MMCQIKINNINSIKNLWQYIIDNNAFTLINCKEWLKKYDDLKNVYSMVHTIEDNLKKIKHLMNIWEDFVLSFMVYEEKGEVRGFFKGESGLIHSEKHRDKVVAEIDRWLDFLGKPAEEDPFNPVLSPALNHLKKSSEDYALARTLRMLLLFKALLLEKDRGNPDYISLKLRKLIAENEKDIETVRDDINFIINNYGTEEINLEFIIISKLNDLLKIINDLKNILSNIEEYFKKYENEFDDQKEKNKKIIKKLQEINNESIKKNGELIKQIKDFQENILISLPLVLVRAIALSQCEYRRPYLWEAYSALRARQEIKKDIFPEEAGKDINANQKFLDLLTYLIRYQSSPGQFWRNTGDDNFLRVIRQGKASYHNVSFDLHFRAGPYGGVSPLERAMRLMGIIQEARNHWLPGYEGETYKYIGKLEVNHRIDTDRELKIDTIKKDFLDRMYSNYIEYIGTKFHLDKTNNTWVYGNFKLYENSISFVDAMNEFKIAVQSSSNNDDVSAFTFGRAQEQSLREILKNYIEKSRGGKWSDFFNLEEKKVPDCFERKQDETVKEVRLKDVIYGKNLLFKEGNSAPPSGGNKDLKSHDNGKENKSFRTDNEELCWKLFDHAREKFKLEDLKLNKGQPLYMPMPVLKRLLETVQRLRPRDCWTLPITYNGAQGRLQDIIYLPKGLSKNADDEDINILVKSIANYVGAVIVNRGMTAGFRTCDLGLQFLESQEKGDQEPGTMTARDWKELIERAYRENAYQILIEKYLRDYNLERQNREIRDSYLPPWLAPVELTEYGKVLKEYYARKNIGEKKYFLGVDIGATLTKFGVYEFENDSLKQLALFEIETGPEIPPRSEKPPGSPAADFLRDLIRRMLGKLETVPVATLGGLTLGDYLQNNPGNIRLVGLAWPGPVRGQRVMGTSGIFKKFAVKAEGFKLTNIILENQIEDIWSLEIAAEFHRILQEQAKGTKLGEFFKEFDHLPGLVNDGDAEGLGALDIFLKKPGGSAFIGSEDRLVVLKIGTGTAGAAFENYRLEPCLNEWGKVLLDKGVKPKASFPEGLANAYLKYDVISNYIYRNYHYLERLRIDPKELDLFWQWQEAGKPRAGDSYKELVNECGLRQIIAKGGSLLNEEVLRAVQAAGKEAKELPDKELSNRLEKEFICGIEQALEEVWQQIKAEGEKRIEKLEKTQDLKKSIEKAAAALGTYIGDFIVLLHDLQPMDAVLLGGGVLKGKKIGDEIKKAAIKRVLEYLFRERLAKGCPTLVETPGGTLILFKKAYKTKECQEQVELAETGEGKPNAATIGAAIFAILNFINARREEGFRRIKEALINLGSNKKVTMEDQRIVFDSPAAPVTFADFCLSREQVKDYLLQYAGEFRLFSAIPDRPATEIFYKY